MTRITGLAAVGVAADIAVVRIRRASTVGMTINTGELVVIRSQVAIRAFETCMPSGFDREVMVKNGLRPDGVSRAMTVIAARRKTRSLMVRIGRIVIIRRVTTIAVLRQVIAFAVAGVAVKALMGTLQRPELGMIDSRTTPTIGSVSMADHAIGGKACILMVRVGRAVIILKMTGNAG